MANGKQSFEREKKWYRHKRIAKKKKAQ